LHLERIARGGGTIKYRTFADESEAYVKIWQQVKAQQNHTGENRRILRFRQRIEHIAKSNIPTPQIVDYGLLESGGLYLITRIESGQLWNEAISEIEDSEHRLQVAISLVTTLIDLHEQGLSHGDIHPDNILLANTTTDSSSDTDVVVPPPSLFSLICWILANKLNHSILSTDLQTLPPLTQRKEIGSLFIK